LSPGRRRLASSTTYARSSLRVAPSGARRKDHTEVSDTRLAQLSWGGTRSAAQYGRGINAIDLSSQGRYGLRRLPALLPLHRCPTAQSGHRSPLFQGDSTGDHQPTDLPLLTYIHPTNAVPVLYPYVPKESGLRLAVPKESGLRFTVPKESGLRITVPKESGLRFAVPKESGLRVIEVSPRCMLVALCVWQPCCVVRSIATS
jgi:hypothetical protein